MEIFNSASTQKGFSLSQSGRTLKKVGLNYQMAFRLAGKSEIRNQKSENSRVAFIGSLRRALESRPLRRRSCGRKATGIW